MGLYNYMHCGLLTGVFNLNVGVDELFFIGSQLVALSRTGKVGVWHAMTQNWQVSNSYPQTRVQRTMLEIASLNC